MLFISTKLAKQTDRQQLLRQEQGGMHLGKRNEVFCGPAIFSQEITATAGGLGIQVPLENAKKAFALNFEQAEVSSFMD